MEPPTLASWTKQYQQECDTCDSNGPLQFFHVEQDDGGGGPFWVIQTERWAIESIEELVKVLREAGVPEQHPGSPVVTPGTGNRG